MNPELRRRVEAVLGPRQFPWRVGIRGWVARCYGGRIRTRCLPQGREHRLRYAA